MRSTASLDRLTDLVSPFGVVPRVGRAGSLRGLDELVGHIATTGMVDNSYRDSARLVSGRAANAGSIGLGNPDHTRLIAIAEAAERYSGGGFANDAPRWARYSELAGAVLDPLSIPRCSATELGNPRCPLGEFDPDATIRWMRGTDLLTSDELWVPAVMACFGLHRVTPAERFWYRISTGYAVHLDPVEALVRGLCEVIERDAIALTWLQRLPWPTVASSYSSDVVDRLLDWCEQHFLDAFLFDATTDLGVPTVYCLLVAPHDPELRQVVGCATGRTIAAAAESALLEAIRCRIPRRYDTELPDDFADFAAITDGARYMGRPEMAGEFAFLTDGARDRVASHRTPLPDAPADALAALLDILARAGMRAIAVDRTTRELSAVGLTSVCVIVPQLQPMTLVPLAQYRGHPRLFQAPSLMGYRSLIEEELNPWPQPFA